MYFYKKNNKRNIEMQNKPIDLKYIYRFPWLPGGREIFEPERVSSTDNTMDSNDEDNISYLIGFLTSLFRKYPRKLYDDLVTIIYFSMDKREEGFTITETDYNVILFYTLKTVLAALNNRVLDNHVANFISKIYYNYLIGLSDLRVIQKLAFYMGFSCEFNELKPKIIQNAKYPFSITFDNYLSVAVLLNDPSWALINRYLEKGKVYLFKENVVRLLQEIIRREVIPKRVGQISDLKDLLKKVPEIEALFKSIENKFELIKIEAKGSKSKAEYEEFLPEEKPTSDELPPCIKFILDKALNGENLTHSERLHIAFFYANANFSVEETIDVFRTVPDFNEETTRYHVEFSRGLKGKGTKYSAYNCDKLRSEHICKGDDKVYGSFICSQGVIKKDGQKYRIKSPLEYMFWYRVEQNRAKRKNTKQSAENTENKGEKA